jgi:hypothetical protein
VSLTFDSVAADWWPYLFILVAGTVATDVWRWIGVLAGSRLKDDSEALVFVRAVATSLVASVIGTLLVFPTGQLAATPLWLRIGAAAIGWLAFRVARRTVAVGVLAGEAALIGGWLLLPG